MTKDQEIRRLRKLLSCYKYVYEGLSESVGGWLDAVVINVGAYEDADRVNAVRRAIAKELERQADELGIDAEGAR